MKLSLPRWDNTNGDLDGLLYFAQRLDEMLFNFSIDLYKAPVLNTHSLLVEYISIYNNTEIDNKYLSVVLEELRQHRINDRIQIGGHAFCENQQDALCICSQGRTDSSCQAGPVSQNQIR